jgi:hypothetical protein
MRTGLDEADVLLEARRLDVDADRRDAHGSHDLAGMVEYRSRGAPDELLVLPIVDRVSALPNQREVIAQGLRGADRPARVCAQPSADDLIQHRSRQPGQEDFAQPRTVGR